MKWSYWIALYIGTHCAARGLRSTTMVAYRATLDQFRAFVTLRLANKDPEQITAADVLVYLQYLRNDRDNGDSAVNRQIVVLKNFYRAIVAMGHLLPADNPLAHFPIIKATPRKLPGTLSENEVRSLLSAPGTDTILGLRDRAILIVLYGAGIRASECSGLREQDVDLTHRTIQVTGKGGHQRTIPLNEQVVATLTRYRQARGIRLPTGPFFESRRKRSMSRGAIYERVRGWSLRAKIPKTVSPHCLRHTFATHLVRAGVKLVTIRDLLGHRSIASTQIYLHVTAVDLREAADRHPIQRLAPLVEQFLPAMKLPLQHPPWRPRATG